MWMRWLTLSCLLLLASCGLPGNVVVLMPDEDGGVGKVTVARSGTTALLEQPREAVGKRGWQSEPGSAFAASPGDITDTFEQALAATPRTPLQYTLYFVLGQASMIGSSQSLVATIIDRAKALPNVDISVIGHADATGGAAENQVLSMRRAEVVRDALVAGGVPTAIIEIGYHGANNPRVPTAPGVAEPRNRRVEVTLR